MENINSFFVITIDFGNSACDTICYDKKETIDFISSIKNKLSNLDKCKIIIEKNKITNQKVLKQIHDKKEFEQLFFDGDQTIINSITKTQEVIID